MKASGEMDNSQQLEPEGMCADKNAVCTNFPDKSTNIRSPSALSLHPYVSPLPSSVHSIFIPFHLPPYLLSPTSVTSLPQHPGPEGIPEVCPDFLKECWTPSEAAKHQALSPYPLLSTAFPGS